MRRLNLEIVLALSLLIVAAPTLAQAQSIPLAELERALRGATLDRDSDRGRDWDDDDWDDDDDDWYDDERRGGGPPIGGRDHPGQIGLDVAARAAGIGLGRGRSNDRSARACYQRIERRYDQLERQHEQWHRTHRNTHARNWHRQHDQLHARLDRQARQLSQERRRCGDDRGVLGRLDPRDRRDGGVYDRDRDRRRNSGDWESRRRGNR
ncbi:MAG: hypothetical protein ACRELD_05240 [Longimicrobiales bacterium]